MFPIDTERSFPIPRFIDSDHRQKLAAIYPKVDSIFAEFQTTQHIPGVVYGIIADGELVHSGAVGLRNVAEQAPVQVDSIYRIASMTKSLTAMAVMKLRDEGKLRLDDPAADSVPELKSLHYPTRDSAPITIRDLLTMAAGFPEDNPWGDRQLDASDEAMSAWIRAGIPFSNPPGIVYEYSNYSYGILGRIAANVSGIRYSDYVTRSILQPLGMTSSTFDANSVPADRYAMGYRLEDDKWVEEPPLGDGAFGSMGGLFTTIPDFARYMAFLMSAFPPRDDEEVGPIRRSSAREMQQAWRLRGLTSARPSPDAAAVTQSDGYGYGLVSSHDSVLGYTVSHGGGLPGYGTFYRMLPNCSVGIVAFGNLTYMSPSPRITEALYALNNAGALKPRTLPPSSVWLEAQNTILSLYEGWDDTHAAAAADPSFFQDMPAEKRREQFKQIRADMGVCFSVSATEPENALRGHWSMHCEHGRIDLFLSLTPTMPPRIQYLDIVTAKPLRPKMRRAASQLLGLARNWDDTRYRTLFVASLKRSQIKAQLEALKVQYGILHLGDVLEGDGATTATVRLVGERSSVDLHLRLEAKSGKLREVSFSRPRELSFVP